MTANTDAQVDALAQALTQQARVLAREHIAAAEQGKRHILDEAHEKARLIEEREVLTAKNDAERLYRGRIQAETLKLAAEADRLRWSLLTTALEELRSQLDTLADDEHVYTPTLQRLAVEAVASVESDTVVIQLNARDHVRYRDRWEKLFPTTGAKTITLSADACTGGGGVIAESGDGRIRMDNTFEGRMSRMEEQIARAIAERLFATVPDMRAWLSA
jgi:V/A-type H+-transporting ATPase subunit E